MSSSESRGKGLNLDATYCSGWGLNEAIREVIQNTIDACVESAEELAKTKTDLRPGGEGWYITKMKKPPKKFLDIGNVAYKFELVLTVRGTEWKKPTNFKDWHEDSFAFGYIKMILVSTEDCCLDPKQLSHAGNQPEKSMLVHLEAVNRITGCFRMKHLQRIGKTNKKNKKHQAGKFGEGFKVGALVAARNGFDVVVEADGKRRQFLIKKQELFCSRQDSKLSKEAQRCKNLINVRLF